MAHRQASAGPAAALHSLPAAPLSIDLGPGPAKLSTRLQPLAPQFLCSPRPSANPVMVMNTTTQAPPPPAPGPLGILVDTPPQTTEAFLGPGRTQLLWSSLRDVTPWHPQP